MRAMRNRGLLRQAVPILIVVALAFLLWRVVDVVLAAFGAALFAILLCWFTDLLRGATGIARGWALALVVLLLAAALAAAGWLFGSQLAAQLGELAKDLPESLRRAQEQLQETEWGRFVFGQAQGLNAGAIVQQLTGIVGSALGLFADLVLVIVAGIYLAAEPDLYRRGILLMVPPSRVGRAEEVLGAAESALRWWLAGQLFAMAAVGIMSSIGLRLLGVHSPFALSVIAGLCEFVPVLGPVIGAVPAVAIGFVQGPAMALYVALLYFVIQQIESNLLMPIIQERVVSLAPALTLFAAVVAGILFGILGVLFATPLTVLVVTLVRMLYVEDALGKRGGSPG